MAWSSKKIRAELVHFLQNMVRLKELLIEAAEHLLFHKSIYYVVENSNWSIFQDGLNITSNLRLSAALCTSTFFIRNSIIHYGSPNTLIDSRNNIRFPHRTNKIVLTWFHIVENDPKNHLIPLLVRRVDFWHTSCLMTKRRLMILGVPEKKITVIPLGLKLGSFTKPTQNEISIIRSSLGLPHDRIIIGSFQKDGIGWGGGYKPKLIKGPDVFCDSVIELAKKNRIFVLLTGPSRGYVKKRLESAAIPYLHRFVKSPDDVSIYYKAIDLYLVTSREEGGPKAVLEALATGIPMISTKVGMAPEIIKNGSNGFLVDIDDVKAITDKAEDLINDKEQRCLIGNNAAKSVQSYDWAVIACRYYNEIYRALL